MSWFRLMKDNLIFHHVNLQVRELQVQIKLTGRPTELASVLNGGLRAISIRQPPMKIAARKIGTMANPRHFKLGPGPALRPQPEASMAVPLGRRRRQRGAPRPAAAAPPGGVSLRLAPCVGPDWHRHESVSESRRLARGLATYNRFIGGQAYKTGFSVFLYILV
jgi:hypothetical protein